VKPSECEEVAKKSHRSTTVGKEEEVMHRMEDGQTHPNECRGTKLPPSTVGTIMKNADKNYTVNANVKQASYSRSEFLEKMEKLLSSSWVDYFNQKNIPLTEAGGTW
jgi:hypothetical protein